MQTVWSLVLYLQLLFTQAVRHERLSAGECPLMTENMADVLEIFTHALQFSHVQDVSERFACESTNVRNIHSGPFVEIFHPVRYLEH